MDNKYGNYMTMSIIKHTHTELVAQKLRQSIASGDFLAGMKMPSTRILANQFNVSQQVVKSALEILEQHNLILRKPRVGIFVNPKSALKSREYCLLSQGGHTINYAATILSITDYMMWDSINIRTRYLSPSDLSCSAFYYELEKVKEQAPACLILSVNLPDIATRCDKLPFPVVFLGDTDSHTGKFANNIVEDTSERAEYSTELAVAEGCSSIVMIGGSANWVKMLESGGEKVAKKHGVNFTYIRHNSGEHKKTIERFLSLKKTPDCLIIDGFYHVDLFLNLIAENGFISGDNLTVITDGEVVKNSIYIKKDFSDFTKEILKHIHQLCESPQKVLGKVVLRNLIKRTVIRTL